MGLPIPLIGAQIIWLNFVTDGFLDISLAMEPHGKNLLARTFEHPNKYLLGATILVALLHVMAVYTPFMQRILHTVPLGWYDWAMAAAIATSVIFAEETRKMISNSAHKTHITTSHHV